MNKWFSILAKSGSDAVDISIYDQIGGWGVSAKQFTEELNAVKAKTVNLHINSPGGDAFEAFAIFNALRNHPARIVAHVDGLAASAASVVMLAGDEVRIAKNAFVMIHNASSGVMGGAEDMRRYAGMLDKINANLAKVYAEKTGKSVKEMASAMDAETWYDADEALAAGLVDAISEESGDAPAAAAKALAQYQTAPSQLRRVAALYIDKPGQSVSPASVDAGTKAAKLETIMNLEAFKAFADEHPDAVATYIEKGKRAGMAEARASEVARAKAVREACGNDALAFDYFLAGKEADEAKFAVSAIAKAKSDADATVKAQAAEIDRLKAQIGTQGPVGTAAAIASVKKAEEEAALIASGKAPEGLEPKAQAEWEWDHLKPTGFSSKDRFVAYRSNELKGTIKVYTRAQ